MQIYCHWDGYPSHNGKLLLENYNTPEKVDALINMGSISILDKSMEAPEGHTFDTPVDGYTIFYHRDRGEKKQIHWYISYKDLQNRLSKIVGFSD